MGEKIGPNETEYSASVFMEAINLFPKEEKADAKRYADIYSKLKGSPETAIEVNDIITTYLLNLEEQDDNIRNYKLYKLLSGNSLSPEEWESIPMDTPNGDLGRFIEEKLAPLLDETEAQRENKE